MVSRPRNHFYRTGRILTKGCGFFCARLPERGLDHVGDLTDQLDLVAVLGRVGAVRLTRTGLS